jgi:hypothetical protein
MAIDKAVENLSEFVFNLPPDFVGKVEGLIVVLKALGVVAIIYVVYLIVMAVVNFRRVKKLKLIEKKVDSIDRKLDRVLKKSKK